MAGFKKCFGSFQYNDLFVKWFWLVVEVLLSSFVGAFIAFLFGQNYWAAIVAFSIIIFFLIAICAVLIIFENRVSVLSIMNQGLKDGRYEDVIKFGATMSPTLFTSNKNEEIVMLGRRIDEAAERIETAPYNKQKGEYRVAIGGNECTITCVRVGILIDDIGWSMHLCYNDKDAIDNIIAGIKKARAEANRLLILTGDVNAGEKSIYPYVRLMMRGYRHLTGIFCADATKQEQARFFENITRVVMSNGRILQQGGVCDSRTDTYCTDNVGGLTCAKDIKRKAECIRTNIFELYFPDSAKSPALTPDALYAFLGPLQVGQMSEMDVTQDVKLFDAISEKFRTDLIREQCYAWSRNIVKRLQKRLDNPIGGYFVSDDEIECKIAEALAFAQVYYYGKDTVPENDGRDRILDQGKIGKSELRYLTLLNEITLVALRFPLMRSSNSVTDIEESKKAEECIDNLKKSRELCKGIRADLYVRNSLNLMESYLIEFNLNFRYAMDLDRSTRRKLIHGVQSKIDTVFGEVRTYEHKMNAEVDDLYKRLRKEVTLAKMEIKREFVRVSAVTDDLYVDLFQKMNSDQFDEHLALPHLRYAIHQHNVSVIESIKKRWRK